jgi:hypothetical protein
MLPIQDEVVSLCAKIDRGRFSKKYEGEAISILGPAFEVEFVRIHAILNRASNERKDVEDHWWLVWVCEISKEELRNHILNYGGEDDEDEGYRDGDRERYTAVRVKDVERTGHHGKDERDIALKRVEIEFAIL